MRIDVHRHYLPGTLVAALEARRSPPWIRDGVLDAGNGLVYPVFPPLRDLDWHRGRMASWRIARSLLSITPGADALPAAEAVAVSRAANDELAALPDGFGALALLPLASPADAVTELRRSAGLGLAGAQLLSNAAGRPLDDVELEPLFAAAAELGMPLVLHPTMPIGGDALAGPELLTALGFVVDTSAAAARVCAAGVFERHPSLVLVLPHAGAVLPVLLERFDLELAALGGGGRLSAPLSEQLRKLHVDAITPSAPALRLALDTFGAERVLYGTDAPIWEGEVTDASLDALGLPRVERELLERGNAERIFR